MRTDVKFVEGQHGVAVVENYAVRHVPLELVVVEDLGRANLGSHFETVMVVSTGWVIMTQLDLRVHAEGLTDHNFDHRVILGHQDVRALELDQVHDDLVREVELLATLTIDELKLQIVFRKVHKRTVLPKSIKITRQT